MSGPDPAPDLRLHATRLAPAFDLLAACAGEGVFRFLFEREGLGVAAAPPSPVAGHSVSPPTEPSKGSRHGVSSRESRDPIGYAVAALNRLAQSELLDRFGLRGHTERAVFTVTRSGFRTATTAGRAS